MSLPGLSISVQDGALGLSKGESDNVILHLGTCSLGTAKQLYVFSDIKTLKDTLGLGPLVEAAAHFLAVAGGPVYCMPINASTAGAAGSVTASGTGPAVSVAGAAKDAYDVVLTIVNGGVLGGAQFTYSLDGGRTVSPPIMVPSGGSYVLTDTGHTLTFGAGTYVAADTYKFTSTAPSGFQGDYTDAITAALNLTNDFAGFHLIGEMASAANAKDLAAAVQTALDTAANSKYRYAFAIVEVPWDPTTNNDSALITAFAAQALPRVVAAAADEVIVSPISGRQYKRNIGFSVAARCGLVPVHEDLGRFARGPLPGVASIDRDEFVTQSLDAQRFTTTRTIPNQDGYFLTTGRTMAAAGSDYSLLQYRRVMDKACRIVRDAAIQFLNESLRVKGNGTLDEKEARRIEGYVQSKLEGGIVTPGSASGVTVTVSRAENVLSSQKLPFTVRIDGLAYAKSITVDIGFTNPALAAA